MLTYEKTFGLSPDNPARLIRKTVFMQEQGFKNEFDQQDQNSWHFVFYLDHQPIACVRLFKDDHYPNYLTLGRVALLKAYRGQHFGLEMLDIVEKEALSMNVQGIVLSAQLKVAPFYEKAGYQAMGEVYMDEHCEHIHMEKDFR